MHVPSYDPVAAAGLPAGRRRGQAREPRRGRPQPAVRDARSPSKFADCFRRSRRSVSGTTATPTHTAHRGRHADVGGCAAGPDAYFGPLRRLQPVGCARATYGGRVNVDFGNRYAGRRHELQVAGERRRPDLMTRSAATTTGIWSDPRRHEPGRQRPSRSGQLDWDGRQPGHGQGCGNCCERQRSRMQSHGTGRSSSQCVRRHAGHGRRGRARPHVADSSLAPPELPFELTARQRHRRQRRRSPVYPTVGHPRRCSRPGIFTTLRIGRPQENQTLAVRSRASTQGQEFAAVPVRLPAVVRGEPVRRTATGGTRRREECPDWRPLVLNGDDARPVRLNSAENPWRCVLRRRAVDRAVGDGMAVATENCDDHRTTNSVPADQLPKSNCGNYDGNPADPTGADGWLRTGGDSNDPRVINLFIVPYQALKGVTGAKRRDPGPRLRVASTS